MRTPAPSILLLAVLWFPGAAWQPADHWGCSVDPRAPEYAYVRGYVDSMGLARIPFPGLFLLADAPCEKVADLGCGFGWKSRRYALMHQGTFQRLNAQEVHRAGRGKAGWEERARYLDLGSRLKAPSALADFQRALDSAGIRTDTAYVLPAKSQWDSLSRDPEFGFFYKKTCSRAFVYGIRYRIAGDSIRLVSLAPYFRFRQPRSSMDWLDGASAVYIHPSDSADHSNMRRVAEFMSGRSIP